MKKIVFIAKKMESGGTEVSLINLINKLKKYNVEITMILLKKEGVYLDRIPKNIKVIEILNDVQMRILGKFSIKNLDIIEIVEVIIAKLLIKFNKKKYLYKKMLKKMKCLKGEYDLAIDFHGYGYFGTVYTIEKITAKKKVTFIHDEKNDWVKDITEWVKKFDTIYCVSKSCERKLIKNYPYLKGKTDIFRNIVDEQKILNLSEENIIDMNENKVKLLTVGRLEYQKGYDLLIEVAKELKNQNFDFIWYIIGMGSQYNQIKKKIKKDNLKNYVRLIGMKINPYPYLKKCEVYVQTSRHEGYGIAIAEARCMNKPIVATDLECIRDQIENKKTGILCEFNKEQFVKEISNLISNENKRAFLSNNLKKAGFKDNNDIKKLLEDKNEMCDHNNN